MQLLVVSSWLPSPPMNGSKIRGLNLLSELVSRGHRVTLLSFAEAGEEQASAHLRDLCEEVVTLPGNPHKAGSALSVRSLFGTVPRSYAQTYSPRMQALIDERVGRHDLALALQIGAAVYFRRPPRIPQVFEEAEVGVVRGRYHGAVQPILRARHRLTLAKLSRFQRALAGQFDRTTVVSSIERDYLIEMGCEAERVCVLPNGVASHYLDQPTESIAQGASLIYTGAVTYEANLDAVQYFVQDILPVLRSLLPDASLCVTGETGRVTIGRLASAGIEFVGHVPDVAPLLSKARACVVPLRIGGGTRLKVLEAMALGTPVVSTSKGVEGLDVTPEEDVLIGDTPADFARQVARVVSDDNLRARLSDNGRRRVASRYTWDRIGAALETVLVAAVDHFQHRHRGPSRGATRRVS